MKGIEVSQWQGDIDFKAIKRADIKLVYIRASEGDDWVDPFFFRNYAGANRMGLLVGFYHYLTAHNEAEAKAEAYHFVRTVNGHITDARLLVDATGIQQHADESIEQTLGIFLQSVQNYTGELPVSYAGNGLHYTDKGRVAGIQGHVVRDDFTEEMIEQEPRMLRINEQFLSSARLPQRYRVYRVKRGDTIGTVAKKFGIDKAKLEQFNGVKEQTFICTGQKLKILE